MSIKTVETENEGLKRAFMLTIPAEDIEARVEREVKRIAPQVRMTEADSAEVNAAHRRILEAVAAHKAGEARAIMAAHIEEVQASLDRSAASA